MMDILDRIFTMQLPRSGAAANTSMQPERIILGLPLSEITQQSSFPWSPHDRAAVVRFVNGLAPDLLPLAPDNVDLTPLMATLGVQGLENHWIFKQGHSYDELGRRPLDGKVRTELIRVLGMMVRWRVMTNAAHLPVSPVVDADGCHGHDGYARQLLVFFRPPFAPFFPLRVHLS